jgi:hypothetical protein
LGGDTAIGTATLGTATKLTIGGSETASGGIARGELNNASLFASANNDVLVGLDVNSTFTNGAFTGVSNITARFSTTNFNSTNAVQLINTNPGVNAVNVLSLASDICSFALLSFSSVRSNSNANQYSTGASGLLDYTGSGSLNISSSFATGTNSGIRFWTASNTLNGTERMRLTAAGRLLLGTTTESTFLLDVNGTARVSGASTFNGNIGLTLNQNGTTGINIANITSGASSAAQCVLETNGGIANYGKYSTTTTAYKILTASSAFLFNGTAGDIAILNDVSTGTIKFAAGGSSTAHMTLASNGNLLVGTTADQGYRVQITGSGDNMLNVWGATAPSIRLDNAASGATQRLVFGLATATNNFIIGAASGDICLTTQSTSPLLFGANSTEAMRISTSANVLIRKTADGGQPLQVNGKVNFASLPTSATGLAAGDIWNNGGVLNIV